MHEKLFSSSCPFGRGIVRGTAGSKELLFSLSSASTLDSEHGLDDGDDADGSVFTFTPVSLGCEFLNFSSYSFRSRANLSFSSVNFSHLTFRLVFSFLRLSFCKQKSKG
jgi:hypothetical protein